MSATTARSNGSKQQYEAPKLTVLGTVRELTQAGKTGMPTDAAGHSS